LKPSDRRNTIRAFIAIPLPKNISLFLCKIQGEIRETGVRASWTQTDSLHLTLRFIGDTPKQDLVKIIRAMENTAFTCAPFTLFAQGVGVFFGKKKAGVIWSGAKGERALLKAVQTTLEKNLVREGLPADNRRFSPHFTLGRFKDRVAKKTLADMMQPFQRYRSDPCRIKLMVLYKSELMPGGAVHTPLFKAEFAGHPPGSE